MSANDILVICKYPSCNVSSFLVVSSLLFGGFNNEQAISEFHSPKNYYAEQLLFKRNYSTPIVPRIYIYITLQLFLKFVNLTFLQVRIAYIRYCDIFVPARALCLVQSVALRAFCV